MSSTTKTAAAHCASVDLEQAIRQYLAQWAHKGCGGQPVTYAAQKCFACSVCAARWPWTHKLGDAVQTVVRRRIFYSLVVK